MKEKLVKICNYLGYTINDILDILLEKRIGK